MYEPAKFTLLLNLMTEDIYNRIYINKINNIKSNVYYKYYKVFFRIYDSLLGCSIEKWYLPPHQYVH